MVVGRKSKQGDRRIKVRGTSEFKKIMYFCLGQGKVVATPSPLPVAVIIRWGSAVLLKSCLLKNYNS